MSEWAFNDFDASISAPALPHSSGRRFFVVARVNWVCELLLGDALGAMQLFSQQQFSLFADLSLDSEHYLGDLDGIPLWVLVINDLPVVGDFQWVGLRSQLSLVPENAFILAGRALQVAQWFYDHQYCSRCGQPTIQDPIDRAKLCSPCGMGFYPRISPCMIVLVTRGDELLLAHHGRSSRLVYSTLAGFVEAGERLEDTVHREVMEEVGIRVTNLEFFKSQPWPFPNQLMLGFFATFESGEIKVDGKEILDAKWFRYDQLPDIPSAASVAGQLINHFVQKRMVMQTKA